MIPVYLCEDEEAIARSLLHEIRQAIMIEEYDMQIVYAGASPSELLQAGREQAAPGIYFLDVDLGAEAMNGFELAKAIRRHDTRGTLIFVTTHGEMSMEAFKYRLEVMDYIIKDDMDTIRQRIRECLTSVRQRMLAENMKTSGYYTVKIFDRIYTIPEEDILYIETSHQKHRLCLHSRQQTLEFFGNLQTVEAELGAGFFRCHRSCLVNRAHIRIVHLKENEIELLNGLRCPLSRTAKKALINK